MYTRKGAMFYLVVLTLLISSSALRAFAQTFTISVVPSTASVNLGEEVTFNVTAADVPAPGLWSYQLKITYNSTLLNATKAEIPSDHMLKPISPSKIFIVKPGDIDQTAGTIDFALTLMGDEPGKTGDGTLVTATFKGLAMGSSIINITDMILVDGDGNEIPRGSYEIETGTANVVPEFSTVALIAIFAIMSAAAVGLKKKLR
jgi:hypothetical protein